MNNYETFKVELDKQVAIVSFNRPDKANSMNEQTWKEMQLVFEEMNATPEVRAIVLTGEGKHFTAGIDIEMLMGVTQYQAMKCDSRKREVFLRKLEVLQRNITAMEVCRKPVLAAIDNACIGGGIDVITACDIRYCTESAYFSVKEIDWGMVADVGTLQRLPKIINSGMAAELAYTGRKFGAQEALDMGLVTRVYKDKEALMSGVLEIAHEIAKKSPVSIRGTKEMLLYTRDHSVTEALNYQAVWNAAMIMSQDLMEAGMANMQKRQPVFED